MEDLVAQPLDRRGYDGGLARVPDADCGDVRQAEDLGCHHFQRFSSAQVFYFNSYITYTRWRKKKPE